MGRRKDRRFMGRAKRLAKSHLGQTGSNPSVGCVIVSSDGYIIGEGVTGMGGRPHGEEIALAMCEAHGQDTSGATAYVTLEPCRERSTPRASCSRRLIEAGIVRIVCLRSDPHPLGAGGISTLRNAGCKVDVWLP